MFFKIDVTKNYINFPDFSLELHSFPIFRWESDTSGTLSLYPAGTCLKLEGPISMHIPQRRTVICN